jgi:hypothetical protein
MERTGKGRADIEVRAAKIAAEATKRDLEALREVSRKYPESASGITRGLEP